MLKLAGEKVDAGLAEHAAALDAHTYNPFQILKVGNYFNSLLRAETENFGYAAIAVDTLYTAPFMVPRLTTWDRIAIRVYTAGAAGAKCRLGIYRDSGACYPGELVLDAGEVDCETTGTKAVTFSQQLTKGLYWLAFIGNDAAIGIARTSFFQSVIGMESIITVQRGAVSQAQAYGSLPASFPDGGSAWEYMWMTALRLASLD